MGPFKSFRGIGSRSKDPGEDLQDQQQRSREKEGIFGDSSSMNGCHVSSSRDRPQAPSTQYEPPAGPPPNWQRNTTERFAPPPGPPPGPTPGELNSSGDNPPPYHDWTIIPDTALLPPPPAMHYEYSTTNASQDDAARAHDWCRQYPLYSPSKPDLVLYDAVQRGDLSLQKPPELKGDLSQPRKSRWMAKTKSSCTDCIFLTTLPLYFAAEDSPLLTQRRKTIYFEMRLLSLGQNRGKEGAGVGIGFCAKPYPSWRFPGWQRGSLGVHSDDGRRFINDPDGGLDFTQPFKAGETVGIGMAFSTAIDRSGNPKAHTEVFFARDGKREPGWQVNEERDVEDDSVAGLEGQLDLYAGIGVFGAVEFEIEFAPRGWLYQP